MKQFKYLSAFIKRSSKLLKLTRDESVRTSELCNDKASAVWNGHNVNIGYYLMVLKLLFERSDNPRYKLTRRQLIEALVEALQEELKHLWMIHNG